MVATTISLTTIPPRLATIGPVLDSLLAQGADRVVLALPRTWRDFTETKYRPPPGVTLLHCEDFGPATKILPARQAFPDDVIVYCDDDCLYAPGWLDALTKSNGLCAGSVFDVARLKRRGGIVVQGFAGVCVPPDVPLPDYVPDAVWAADDLWLSAWFEAHGVRPETVPEARACVTPLERTEGLQQKSRAYTYRAALEVIEAELDVWPKL